METRWMYVTSEELSILREEAKGVCVIPMGCVEKHGLHLPLGTDILEGSRVAYMASQLEPVCVFPDYIFGDVPDNSPERPLGSVTVPVELNMKMLETLCEQIAMSGFRKIVVYNAHGGNCMWLRTFQRNLGVRRHDFVFVIFDVSLPAPHAMAELLQKEGLQAIPELEPEDAELLLKYHEQEMLIGHACFGETANIMGICPDAVKLDRLGVESGLPTGKSKPYNDVGLCVVDGGWGLEFPNAYAGHDPIGCNERIGRAALRLEAERFAKALKVLKDDELLLQEHNRSWHTNI